MFVDPHKMSKHEVMKEAIEMLVTKDIKPSQVRHTEDYYNYYEHLV